ncbi:MAG: hypothetical protein Q3M24_15715 [Candidatus Electrothrix aestuarii]|uniref:Uncharacterized protein n=1 Tax=Candidatus Electrothrix aestuarii TaxID=3062594 RepID=A0AAU8LR79_9BACT|nr:hypothetical protein [Candidatus Electrothrix aestuarii]WPD21734.1 MAG: hypothetical protein SD837_16185 [Candidatus Electrothrix sp. GW3-3]
MKKNNLFSILTILLASCALWATNSFAALGQHPIPDLSGLTVAEAETIYGVGSGFEHPLSFEVNSKHGSQKCVSIGPDCSKACPTPKIYYQSPQHRPTHDGSNAIRVDVYFDINEPVTSRSPSC